jgi:hypothetical protein
MSSESQDSPPVEEQYWHDRHLEGARAFLRSLPLAPTEVALSSWNCDSLLFTRRWLCAVTAVRRMA